MWGLTFVVLRCIRLKNFLIIPRRREVIEMTRYVEAPVSPCPGRMGATPLKMAEHAETRGRQHSALHPADLHPAPSPHGDPDAPSHTNAHVDGPSHTNAHVLYEAIDETYPFHGTCSDCGVDNCGCCEHEVVGTEDMALASF